MKNETIEETAERLIREDPDFEVEGFSPYQNGKLNGFIQGAYWKQERMYSEEDMIKFSEWTENSEESANFWRKNKRSPTMDASYNIFMHEKRIELFEIWKKQFKK